MSSSVRKVVSAFDRGGHVFAVCDDGTVWRLDEGPTY